MISYSKSLLLYSLLSVGVTALVVHREFQTHKKFYTAVLSLVSNPLNILIMCNFGMVSLHLAGILFVKLFFGALRNLEVQYFYEQATKRLFYVIIVFYFTGIDIKNLYSLLLLLFEILMFATHKLIFKRADYISSISLNQAHDFKKLSILFSLAFFFDSLFLNAFLSYDSLLHALTDSNTETYIQLLVALGILTM